MKKLDIVCGIIWRNHKVLVAKRGKGIHENIWEFPGGKVEVNETKEEAVVREIKEELEIDVSVKRYLTSIVDEREDCILHVHAYICSYLSGEIQLHAHHEYAWINVNDVSNYNFEKADKPILAKLQEESI